MVILSERSVWSCAVCVYRPDPEQAGLATGGVLPRHEPDPCRKLLAILKMARLTDGRHEGRGRQRPNTWDSQGHSVFVEVLHDRFPEAIKGCVRGGALLARQPST